MNLAYFTLSGNGKRVLIDTDKIDTCEEGINECLIRTSSCDIKVKETLEEIYNKVHGEEP